MIRFKNNDGSNYPEWERKQLKEIAKVSGGYAFDSKKMIDEKTNYQIIKMGNLYQGNLDLSRTPSYIEEATEKELNYLLKNGDIAITLTGTVNKHDYGYSYLFTNEKNLLLNQRLGLIRVNNNTDSRFLVNIIKGKEFLKQFYSTATGGTGNQTNVSTKAVEQIFVNIPCLEEQQKIADFLSNVDEVIAASEKEVAVLEEQKKGAMQKIFSQEVRFKADDGSDYPEWEEILLGGLSELYTGKSFTNDLEDDGKYIVMDMGTVSQNGFRIESKHTNLLRDALKKDDLVMPKDDIGGGFIICKTVHIPENNKYVLGDHVYRLHFDSQDGLFMHYLINSEAINRSFKRKVTGSAQLGIKAQNVLNQLLPIPCLEEQQKIADFLSDMDTAIELAKQELEQWKELKKGLLQQLFE